MEYRISFLIGQKDGYLVVQVERLSQEKQMKEISWKAKGRICAMHFANDLILNSQNQDVKINYLENMEVNPHSAQTIFFNSWVTDLPITEANAHEMIDIARARWKIENETFNTLKNHGYHLEHNFGHGTQYLATNFAT